MAEYNLSPEFAFVQALETVSVLKDRVTALQPKKGVKPPLSFYVPNRDDEEQALDGGTGLQTYAAQLHLVGGTYRGLLLLCARAKKAILAMRGATYSTPENEPGDVLRGRILVEDTAMTLSSPDLYEAEVGYYRRVYTVQLDYQTEEVSDEN